MSTRQSEPRAPTAAPRPSNGVRSVQPPPLPAFRPTAPAPASPPPARKPLRLLRNLIGLALVLLVSGAVGAFALPGPRSRSAATQQPAAPPEVAADPGPKPTALNGAPSPDDRAPEEKTPPPSTFDLPRIQPRLPSTSGALGLSVAIDRAIDKALADANVPASPLASDAEFLRRVYLDLTGRVPSRDRTVAFLDDPDPYKRSKLIDELLASPEHGLHFARIWADLLVKRDFDTNKNLKTGPFIGWLAERFNKNDPWNRIVTEMITAAGPEETVPQSFFVMANQDNKQPSPAKLVGASANLFMGIQLQCAECHVHPFTAKWEQKDFWGLAAFFGHTRADRGAGPKAKNKNGPAVLTEVENAGAPLKKKAKQAGKAVPSGLAIAVPDPTDPRKTLRTVKGRFFESNLAVPTGKAPYRPALAKWLASADNRYFAPAAVNRTWAHFFARGLVNPIEDMHDENKASHPGLLKALAADFTTSGHDLRRLMRAIANSQAYQRTSRPLPGNKTDEKLASHMPVRVMSAHQLLDSLAVVTNGRPTLPKAGMAKGAKAGAKTPAGTGGNPLVRFFDTREYDDDAIEFSYGIPQLLRLMNSGLTASNQALAARLARSGDRAKVIEELYLTALSRRPSPAEVERIAAYVARHDDPVKGYAGALWALLNCAEFISVR